MFNGNERERERGIYGYETILMHSLAARIGAHLLWLQYCPLLASIPSLFSSRIIDVGGRGRCRCVVAAFLGRPQHSRTHRHTHTHSLLEIMQECSLPVLHLFIFLHPPSVCSALPSSSSSSSDSFTSDSLASSSSSSSRCEHDALRFSPFNPSLLLLLLPLQYLVSPHSNLVFFILWKATTTVRTKRMVKCL